MDSECLSERKTLHLIDSLGHSGSNINNTVGSYEDEPVESGREKNVIIKVALFRERLTARMRDFIY